MTVNPLELAQGAVLYAVLLWKVYQLVKAPHDVALRAVVGCLACFALAFPIGLLGNTGHTADIKPLWFGLAQHTLLLGAIYCLNLFFLYAGLDTRAARRRAALGLLPLGAALAVMVVSAAVTPADIPLLRQSYPSVGVFFLAADGYLAYGVASALFVSRHYAAEAERTLATGLRIARCGLAAVFAGTLVFIATVVSRLSGAGLPRPVVGTGIVLILLGAIAFLVGMSYLGAVMRLLSLRIWLAHRRSYHQLRPLWTMLHEAFPEDALNRARPGRWRDALSVRGTHRRYYRRVIECRDGLVRISPYLPELPVDDSAALAGELRSALRAQSDGAAAPSGAHPVATPTGEDLDSDVRQLVALSLAL